MLPPNDRAAHLSYLRLLGDVVSLPRTIVSIDCGPRLSVVCSPSSSEHGGVGDYDPFSRMDFDEPDAASPAPSEAVGSAKPSTCRRTVCEWDRRFWRIETLDEWGLPIGHVRYKRRRGIESRLDADMAGARGRITAWFGTLWAKVRQNRSA